VPNSVAVLGNFEFVSVQTTGQIFTYDISSGVQAQVGAPYATPCDDPSGMAIATIGAADVMAVVCYDTGSLLTLNVDADGSLRALGSVGGLSNPYPGLVLDGTNVLVPLFGKSGATNGGVAKVSLLDPAHPVVAATATLASPVPGGFANPGYLLASGGYIYVAAGSESAPLDASSTIQQIAIQGTVAYVTLLDAAALEAIDISNPANLQALQTVSFSAVSAGCHPEPVTVQGSFVYVGCYYEGILYRLNVSGLLNPQTTLSLTGIAAPQRLVFASDRLLVPSSSNGGSVYQIALSAF
jgi:hypothetical protein